MAVKRKAPISVQIRKLEKSLTRVLRVTAAATSDATEEEFRKIFDKSQTYVPVETGELKRSGFFEVTPAKVGSDLKQVKDGTIRIGYALHGEPDYAVHVHENLEAYHEPPTRAKFLDAAIQEELPGIQQRLASKVKGAINV